MKKRAYVLIFFFWAFLTIITPTLIQWSSAATAATKGDSQSKEDTNGKENSHGEGSTIARKMMKLTIEIGVQGMTKAPPRPPPAPGVAVVSSLPPAPAPKDDDTTKEEPRIVLLLKRLIV